MTACKKKILTGNREAVIRHRSMHTQPAPVAYSPVRPQEKAEVHEPFNMRPDDYRYCLRTDDDYGWQTGRTLAGFQVLHCKENWLLFDQEGVLLQVGAENIAFQDEPIYIRRFWLPDRWMGIEDLDSELALFYTNPEEFTMEEKDIASWIRIGQFVFHCGWNEYVLGSEGQVEVS